MNKRTIGTIALTRPRPFRGAAPADFADWIAARWDVTQRSRIGRAPAVYRKSQGAWAVVERHVQTGWQSGIGAVHANFRLGLNLQFTHFVLNRAAAIGVANSAPSIAPRSMARPSVFRSGQFPIWRTLESWMRYLGQASGMREGAPAAAGRAGADATASAISWRGGESPAARYFATHTSRNDSWMWSRLVNQYTTTAGANRLTVILTPAGDDAGVPSPGMTSLASWLLSKSESTTWRQVPVVHRIESGNTAGRPIGSNGVAMTPAWAGGRRAADGASEYHSGAAAPITLAHAKPSRGGEPDVAQSLMQIQQTLSAIKPREASPQPVDIPHLTRQVYDQFERELRIERERRGL